MRIGLAVVFFVLVLLLIFCTMSARRSKKDIKGYVAFLIAGMAVPVLGNLILIISTEQIHANYGFYVYFLGMDIAVFSLFWFTFAYCELGKPKIPLQILIFTLFGIDMIHYLFNPLIGCSFTSEMILVENLPYYRLIPLAGQIYHRIICYGLFFVSLIIFLVKALKSTKVYAEKYWALFFTILATGIIESYYIFSRQPMDISMIGFGVFGLLVYYVTIFYRPMKLLDRMLAFIASDMPDALFFFDNSGKCIWTNEPGRNLIGVAKDNYDDVKENLKFLFGDIEFTNGWSKKIILGTGDEALYTNLAVRSVLDEKGNTTGSYLSVRDVTEDTREMKREMFNATHDSLTGFYTKEYLFEKINKRLKNDKTTDYMIGYMEIANIKVINDVFGSKFAELTMKKAAELVLEGINSKSLYGRLSDDAFGILIDKEDFMNKPVDEKLSTFKVSDGNLEQHIRIHYGVYDIAEDDEIDIPLFFDSARLATTTINENYTDVVVYYDDKLRNEIIHNQLISNQVHEAIETNQIRPYLQPIVDGQGLLAGAEALVRWIHPEEGFMNPGAFIPVFERNGFIAEVDRHMWKCACEILADWKKRGIEAFISINISPKDFYLMDVVKELTTLTQKYEIDPVKLRVEITETVMANDSINMIDIVKQIRDHGFIVEMDDFGSGYSSLNLLKDMNIDLIKIDMMFLRDSERNMKVWPIIKNIINMATDLGIDTLTEGVETAKQFEYLFSDGCKLYQGYYFSKPVPLEDFEKQWFD